MEDLTRPLHVVIVFEAIFFYSKGGAQKRLYEIARGLHERGYKVTWIGLKYWEGPDSIEIDGIRLEGLMPDQEMRASDGGRRTISGALKYCLAILRHRFPVDADIILAGQAPLIHVLFLKLKMIGSRIPIVVDYWEAWHSHWLDYYGNLLGRLGILLEKTVLSISDHLIAISDMTFNKIREYGIMPNKISLAHNGVSWSIIQSLAAATECYDIVYFGRLVRHKNVDVLVKATFILKQKIPDLKVLIIGDGAERGYLEDLVEQLDLRETIKFKGSMHDHNDALRLLKASKISVIPSTSEGGGSIALFEANACGLPVIAVEHDQGIDRNLISDGVNGYWVNCLSEHLIAERAYGILNDSALLEKMRKNAIQAMEQFDWSKIVDIYSNLFLELSSKKAKN